MMNKQAILIMYHTDYSLLIKKLKLLDSKNIDIYLHIDRKVKDFDYKHTKEIIKESRLFFTKRLNVKWGTYTQIKCELLLLKEAVNNNNYMYYHLLSGVDMPIKKIDIIYHFFSNNYPKEFIAYNNFDNISEDLISRIKYYHLFNFGLRDKNKLVRKISNKLYYNTLKIEKKLKINRLINNNLLIRKGANWFSITDNLAKYIISQENLIKKIFSHSYCADELFIQTLVYNSEYKNNIYREYQDEHENIYRLIDWKRGMPYTFKIDDFEMIKNSNCFFARKFSSNVDKKIIDKIYNYVRSSYED